MARASNCPQLAIPKPEPRKRTKARKQRSEKKVIESVRAECVERDGFCRLGYVGDSTTVATITEFFGPCRGRSEWSHYNATHRRSKTMGMPPEERHQRTRSMMLCTAHACEYDQNRMTIETLTDDGCDGRLRFERDGQVWEEV